MKQNFDWNDLNAFLAIMRTGKLTTAANLLKIDHTTLSRRVSRLENSLKVKLFDRLTIGYRPTSDAEQLLPEAEAIESLATGIYAQFADELSELTGTVRIAGPEGFGTYFFVRRISRFNKLYPNLEIELIANPKVVSLSKREAEMAITNIRPTKGPLHALKLTDYELGVYGSHAYLADTMAIQQKNDLERHRFIGYIENMLPAPEHDYLNEISRAITPQLRISNILTQLSATKAGAGLCILPCFMAAEEADLVRILAEEIRIIRSYWLVIQSDARRLARVRTVVDFIVNTVRSEKEVFLPEGNCPKLGM